MPVTIKAAVLFGPNQPMEIREVQVADPGKGEVMIKLRATGLCHSDLHVIDGSMQQVFPVILGHEGVGDVVAVGEGVEDFMVGDRVIPYLMPDCGECAFCKSGRTNLCVEFGKRQGTTKSPFSLDGEPVAAFMNIGTFAEVTVVAADMLTKVDKAAKVEHACCIGCGVTTGIGAATISAKVTKGSSVAVFGCGGVGLSVIQGVKLAGAEKIIAVDTNPGKAEVARKLGATDFVNPKDVENLSAHIMGMTGTGVDFSFECVGVPALAIAALESTNPAWGLSCFVGVMPAGQLLNVEPFSLVAGRRLTGSFMGGAKRQDVSRFVDMYVRGDFSLDELVSHKLSLEEINHGFKMMKTGEAVRSVVLFNK